MTKVTCSDCGKEAEVPFKPTEGKPVYCRDCYQKHKQYQIAFKSDSGLNLTLFFFFFIFFYFKKRATDKL